jgi:hypothetical protein
VKTTDVQVIDGPRRGRRGWIWGVLQNLNPHVTKVLVHFGQRLEAVPIAVLATAADPKATSPQLELALT